MISFILTFVSLIFSSEREGEFFSDGVRVHSLSYAVTDLSLYVILAK